MMLAFDKDELILQILSYSLSAYTVLDKTKIKFEI